MEEMTGKEKEERREKDREKQGGQERENERSGKQRGREERDREESGEIKEQNIIGCQQGDNCFLFVLLIPSPCPTKHIWIVYKNTHPHPSIC